MYFRIPPSIKSVLGRMAVIEYKLDIDEKCLLLPQGVKAKRFLTDAVPFLGFTHEQSVFHKNWFIKMISNDAAIDLACLVLAGWINICILFQMVELEGLSQEVVDACIYIHSVF